MNPFVFVATPFYGPLISDYVDCITNLQAAPPCNLIIRRLRGDPVHIARNKLVGMFLKSEATHLLWVDSDQVFNGKSILKLLSHDVDIVGASICQKKPDDLRWCFKPKSENGIPVMKCNEAGLMPVDAIGTGFTLIKRQVFEKIISLTGEAISYCNDPEEGVQHEFYPSGIYQYPDGSRQLLGEDFYFCRRWLDIGGEMYADTKLVIPHIGNVSFPIKEQIQNYEHIRGSIAE